MEKRMFILSGDLFRGEEMPLNQVPRKRGPVIKEVNLFENEEIAVSIKEIKSVFHVKMKSVISDLEVMVKSKDLNVLEKHLIHALRPHMDFDQVKYVIDKLREVCDHEFNSIDLETLLKGLTEFNGTAKIKHEGLSERTKNRVTAEINKYIKEKYNINLSKVRFIKLENGGYLVNTSLTKDVLDTLSNMKKNEGGYKDEK